MYMISLPANRLELFCLIESERIRNTVLREFYIERSVIQEERKQTTDAVPTRLLSEMFMGAAFIAHPYNHPVVGWASDINSVTLEEAQAFKQKYYTPNNCVLAIVGDVYPEKAIPLDREVFRGHPPRRGPARLPDGRAQAARRAPGPLRVRRRAPAHDGLPQADLPLEGRRHGLRPGLHPDHGPDVADLQGPHPGQAAGRLGLRRAQSPGVRFPNLFTFNAVPRFPHTVEEVEKAILEHVEKVKTEPVSERELQKVKNNLDASYIRSMSSNFGIAMTAHPLPAALRRLEALQDVPGARRERHGGRHHGLSPRPI